MRVSKGVQSDLDGTEIRSDETACTISTFGTELPHVTVSPKVRSHIPCHDYCWLPQKTRRLSSLALLYAAPHVTLILTDALEGVTNPDLRIGRTCPPAFDPKNKHFCPS